LRKKFMNRSHPSTLQWLNDYIISSFRYRIESSNIGLW
jgi:hypothetical protein